MNAFINSTSGRLISFSLALGLIGGGASVHMAETTSLYVMCASIFLAIVGCVAALQLGVDEHETPSLMGAILLPFFLFLYVIGLGVSTKFYPSWSYGFIALGLASLLVGLRSVLAEKDEPVSAKPMARAATPATQS